MKQLVVVGAGISGLSVAFWAERAGWTVTVLEAAGVPGGTMRTVREGGWLVENGDPALMPFVGPVKRGLDALQQATMWLAQHGLANPNDAGAAAADYLRLMGIVVVGWMWARMAKVAQAG